MRQQSGKAELTRRPPVFEMRFVAGTQARIPWKMAGGGGLYFGGLMISLLLPLEIH